MSFPIDALSLTQRELGLVLAVPLGFAFGFVLERAGFGRATKLAAQFYLTDMTVLKVMFTAIVTAMGGLLVASGLGLTDHSAISQSIASWTWIWPMLIGGFVLGVGFIVSGYCPGTSIVAAASGNVDGMVAFAGVASGAFVYNLLLEIPAVAAFHASGELGPKFLHELSGVPAPVAGAAVAAMAIGAFIGAEKVEAFMRRRSARDPGTGPVASEVRPRRFAFATIATMAALALMLLGFPQGGRAEVAPAPAPISAEELARRMVDEPWSVLVLDLRPAAEFAANRIPASESVAPDQLGAKGLALGDPAREIVIVTGDPSTGVPAGIGSFERRVRLLEGGWPAWKAFALDAPQAPSEGATAAELDLHAFRSALQASLTGQRPPAVAATPARAVRATRAVKTGGGCSE